MPLDNFYQMPDWLVLRHWIGVKKAHQRQINSQSLATAQVASMVYNYLRDNEKSESLTAKDFLPFNLDNTSIKVSLETAKIFVRLAETGKIPANILDDINRVNNGELLKSIVNLVRKDG